MIKQNLIKNPLRSLVMTFLLFILAFTVFSSSMILESLELGINSTIGRMGADIIVVPSNYVSRIQNALFTGAPSTVYFDRDWVKKIEAVQGVGRTSTQLFLATLSDSDCCDNAMQIIAFDPGTDFVVQPWIQQKTGGTLSKNQIVVGNSLKYSPGDTARYYGQQFKVAAKLDKTGMGYDNTVFMTYETAYDLVQNPIAKQYFSIGCKQNLISMITLRVTESYDISKVAENIAKLYGNSGISVYAADSLLSGISANVKNLKAYSGLLNGLFLLSTIFALLCIFNITINARRREFGILRTLGASRPQIILLITGEAEILSVAGCLLGSLAAWYLIYSFQYYIIDVFKVPFLQPQLSQTALTLGKCLLVSLVAGLAASFYAALRIGLAEPYALMREDAS